MDKIWDRKSFEVGGHWPLWRGWKNRMTTQKQQKSNAKKTTTDIWVYFLFLRVQLMFVKVERIFKSVSNSKQDTTLKVSFWNVLAMKCCLCNLPTLNLAIVILVKECVRLVLVYWLTTKKTYVHSMCLRIICQV